MPKSGKELRLGQQRAELQQKWELLSQKLVKLEKQKILATQSDEQFRIENLITEISTERQQVGQQLDELEQQLATASQGESDESGERNEEHGTPYVAPFVGREAELQQLHHAFTAVRMTQKPKFILIQGDFGVGKTALAEHFLTEVAASNPEVLIGQGKCTLETESNGLIPFSHLFRELLGRAITRRVISGSVADFARAYAPAWVDIMAVGETKSSDSGGRLTGRSQFSQENVFVQFTNALSRLAEKQPLLVFIDDLHWADASSLALLFHTARYLPDRAVLFVGTYRPVEAMETGTNAPLFREMRANLLRYGAAEVELRQGIAVADYAAQRYPAHAFAPELLARVQELTGGYALFVSQVFSLWEDTGVLQATLSPDGQTIWELSPGAEASPIILPTLSAVLDERIRLMETGLRDMLTCASVEGEDFTAQVVASLRQLDDTKVFDNLETLQHRYRLIQEQGSKDAAATVMDFYRFAHRFFREHIYSQLSSGKRRMLHKQVAECLEALYHDNDEIAGQLALHFREAHEPLKAAQYALRAAKFEQTRYAWAEAERWCEFGLTLIDKLPVNTETKQLKLDLLEQSGYGYNYCGKYDQAYENYQLALTLAQELQVDAERIANFYYILADIIGNGKGRYMEARTFAEQGKQILSRYNLPFNEILFKLETMWASAQAHTGNHDLAIQHLRKVMTEADMLPHSPTLDYSWCRAYGALAYVLSGPCLYKESIVARQKAIELSQKMDDKYLEADNLVAQACIYYWLNDIEQGMALGLKGLQISRQIGALDVVAFAKDLLGSFWMILGKFPEAINELAEAISISEQIGALWCLPVYYADLSLAYLAISDLETAYQKAKIGVTYAEKQNFSDNYQAGLAFDALAQAESDQRDWELSARHFMQAIAFHEKSKDRQYIARTQRHFAEALLKQGKTPEAVALLQTALTTFQELHLEYEIVATQQVLGLANHTDTRDEEAVLMEKEGELCD